MRSFREKKDCELLDKARHLIRTQNYRKAIEELEFRLKSGWGIDEDFVNRLKLLLNRILKEFR